MSSENKNSKKWETLKSLGIALLVALSIRAFVIEPYKIPSTSMKPTLIIGDHLFVNKFIYGLRIPWTLNRFWEGRDPKRGEVIIFNPPIDPKKHYIKRVIGVPGDRIQIRGTTVTINGEALSQTPIQETEEFSIYEEIIGGVIHQIQYDKSIPLREDFEIVVPPGFYLVMGDNRDHSRDSRDWGFLERKRITGRAMFLWFSWKFNPFNIHWERIGQKIE